MKLIYVVFLSFLFSFHSYAMEADEETEGYYYVCKQRITQFVSKKLAQKALSLLAIPAKQIVAEEIESSINQAVESSIPKQRIKSYSSRDESSSMDESFSFDESEMNPFIKGFSTSLSQNIADGIVDYACTELGKNTENIGRLQTRAPLEPQLPDFLPFLLGNNFSKLKVGLETCLEDKLLPLLQKIKPHIRPTFDSYGGKVVNYVSVSMYAATSGITYMLTGKEFAVPILALGLIDVIMLEGINKSGLLKRSLKSIFSYDKLIDLAETCVIEKIDALDSAAILKLYNLEVTEEDRRTVGTLEGRDHYSSQDNLSGEIDNQGW